MFFYNVLLIIVSDESYRLIDWLLVKVNYLFGM